MYEDLNKSELLELINKIKLCTQEIEISLLFTGKSQDTISNQVKYEQLQNKLSVLYTQLNILNKA